MYFDKYNDDRLIMKKIDKCKQKTIILFNHVIMKMTFETQDTDFLQWNCQLTKPTNISFRLFQELRRGAEFQELNGKVLIAI